MSLLDAKGIHTTHGVELYVDLVKNVNIKELLIPTVNNPFYGVKLEIDYLLLKEHKHYEHHYEHQKNSFWIVMDENLSSITLKEPEMESLFAIKNEEEREATKQLLGEWFIKTTGYKAAITQNLTEFEQNNSDMKENEGTKKTIQFLKRLLELKTADIVNAFI
ncbi:hypothetical protein [Priestia filamentosa]|uniref:Uncharacterized protein n=1 Tax=Priestia filamentosa TaxID=1402861 RepID=A0A1X7EJU0_9BACI|nr:hypothetical protein [Priestia filamentosa]AKO93013.1 hypothetical protein BEH_13540 [Priestia filamentosa]MDT3763160.1 hypothetical protein [Priestia filamentosa]OXS69672.1 hypothetical protein B1B01_11985 [Priestia filamentosa]RJS63678.1 hypothetical protein CJ485_02630 [Priestia filamentosa]WCM14179.1 hypothetical protein PGN40_12540 [Priestia filamentosa]